MNITVMKMLSAVHEAGMHLKGLSRAAIIKEGEGHRSIESQDRVSQAHILSCLENLHNVRFICEEKTASPKVLSKAHPEEVFKGEVVVFDELDGTTLYADQHPEWTVGAGLMYNGRFEASAICAPDANGGIFCYSDQSGVFCSEREKTHALIPPPAPKDAKSSIILRGVDTELYQNITNIMPRIAANVRAAYIKGSGLFALMYLALGRAEAVIQTPQKIHDWAPAYHLVVKSGRVFRFFRLKDGCLVPVVGYDAEAFAHAKETRLGFVAGAPGMANRLFAALPRIGWERHNPDLI